MAPKSLFHKLTFFVGGTLVIAILILGHASMDKTVFSKSVISQRLQALKSHLTVFSDSYFGNASKGKHYTYVFTLLELLLTKTCYYLNF